ncbi:hypothetical protein QJQ45_019474 [Haematococcus lacustris]|nr:hypothetical protein QJQ45_019474 [Haematococcus lacustris]
MPAAAPPRSQAERPPLAAEVAAESSPWIQGLQLVAAAWPSRHQQIPNTMYMLRRTEEKKEERRKERLNDYYRQVAAAWPPSGYFAALRLHCLTDRQINMLASIERWSRYTWCFVRRRNFRDYFQYEASSPDVAKSRGIAPETQAAIAKWLKDNP